MSNVYHFIGPEDKIRTIRNDLSGWHGDLKTSKKDNHTHLFIGQSDVESSNILPQLGKEWSQCSSCNMCTGKITKGREIKYKYALYPPLILLPTNTQISYSDATKLLDQFENCTHVAVNSSIKEGDRVRAPQLIPIIGEFDTFHEESIPKREWLDKAFYASCVQNGIYQTWAPLYTMFSRGNITEKKRVLTDFKKEAPIEGNTIIDFYVGIGYFTFSYAKQRPKRIYCWEINHWSVEGLVRAAKQNKFQVRVVQENEAYVPHADDFIVVFLEDNQRCLQRLPQLELSTLTHVNMGLLPHARDAFNIAKEVLKISHLDPVIHIHENVRTVEINSWALEMESLFGKCITIERIKEYSPGVQHLCGDFRYAKDKAQKTD